MSCFEIPVGDDKSGRTPIEFPTSLVSIYSHCSAIMKSFDCQLGIPFPESCTHRHIRKSLLQITDGPQRRGPKPALGATAPKSLKAPHLLVSLEIHLCHHGPPFSSRIALSQLKIFTTHQIL